MTSKNLDGVQMYTCNFRETSKHTRAEITALILVTIVGMLIIPVTLAETFHLTNNAIDATAQFIVALRN